MFPNLGSRFEFERRLALSRVNNESQLAAIAESDPSHAIRQFALNKMTNQSELGRIAMGESLSNLDAIDWISDEDILFQIVLFRDADWLCQNAALQKISDQALLAGIVVNGSSQDLRNSARRQLTVDGLLAASSQSVDSGEKAFLEAAVEIVRGTSLIRGIPGVGEDFRREAGTKLFTLACLFSLPGWLENYGHITSFKVDHSFEFQSYGTSGYERRLKGTKCEFSLQFSKTKVEVAGEWPPYYPELVGVSDGQDPEFFADIDPADLYLDLLLEAPIPIFDSALGSNDIGPDSLVPVSISDQEIFSAIASGTLGALGRSESIAMIWNHELLAIIALGAGDHSTRLTAVQSLSRDHEALESIALRGNSEDICRVAIGKIYNKQVLKRLISSDLHSKAQDIAISRWLDVYPHDPVPDSKLNSK